MKKLVLFFLGFTTIESQCSQLLNKLGQRKATSPARAIRLLVLRRASNRCFVPSIGKPKKCTVNQLKFPDCIYGYPHSCSFWPCLLCPRLSNPPENE